MLLCVILQTTEACSQRSKRIIMHEIDILFAHELLMVSCTVEFKCGFVGKGDRATRDGQNCVGRQFHQVLVPFFGFPKSLLRLAAPYGFLCLCKCLLYGRPDASK